MSNRQMGHPTTGAGSTIRGDMGGRPPASARVPKEDLETIQRRERAQNVLGDYQLLTKYAIENDLSIPRVRLYFEKVASGIKTDAIIKQWFPA